MYEKDLMRYTPIDIMHKLKTRLNHSVATKMQPIRNADLDLMHVVTEIDYLIKEIKHIQSELCEMFSPRDGLRDEMCTLIDHILTHMDELHYTLRDRATISGGSHNKLLEKLQHNVNASINDFLTKYSDIFKGYSLSVGV